MVWGILRKNHNKEIHWTTIYNEIRERDPDVNPESVSRCLRDLAEKNPNVTKGRTKGTFKFNVEDTKSAKLDDLLFGR